MAGKPRRRERLAREARFVIPKPPIRRPPKPQPPRRTRLFVISGAHGDPLEILRDGLALARRAGMPWEQAIGPARITALSVESNHREREEWAAALEATLTAWRNAYERRPTTCKL